MNKQNLKCLNIILEQKGIEDTELIQKFKQIFNWSRIINSLDQFINKGKLEFNGNTEHQRCGDIIFQRVLDQPLISSNKQWEDVSSCFLCNHFTKVTFEIQDCLKDQEFIQIVQYSNIIYKKDQMQFMFQNSQFQSIQVSKAEEGYDQIKSLDLAPVFESQHEEKASSHNKTHSSLNLEKEVGFLNRTANLDQEINKEDLNQADSKIISHKHIGMKEKLAQRQKNKTTFALLSEGTEQPFDILKKRIRDAQNLKIQSPSLSYDFSEFHAHQYLFPINTKKSNVLNQSVLFKESLNQNKILYNSNIQAKPLFLQSLQRNWVGKNDIENIDIKTKLEGKKEITELIKQLKNAKQSSESIISTIQDPIEEYKWQVDKQGMYYRNISVRKSLVEFEFESSSSESVSSIKSRDIVIKGRKYKFQGSMYMKLNKIEEILNTNFYESRDKNTSDLQDTSVHADQDSSPQSKMQYKYMKSGISPQQFKKIQSFMGLHNKKSFQIATQLQQNFTAFNKSDTKNQRLNLNVKLFPSINAKVLQEVPEKNIKNKNEEEIEISEQSSSLLDSSITSKKQVRKAKVKNTQIQNQSGAYKLNIDQNFEFNKDQQIEKKEEQEEKPLDNKQIFQSSIFESVATLKQKNLKVPISLQDVRNEMNVIQQQKQKKEEEVKIQKEKDVLREKELKLQIKKEIPSAFDLLVNNNNQTWYNLKQSLNIPKTSILKIDSLLSQSQKNVKKPKLQVNPNEEKQYKYFLVASFNHWFPEQMKKQSPLGRDILLKLNNAISEISHLKGFSSKNVNDYQSQNEPSNEINQRNMQSPLNQFQTFSSQDSNNISNINSPERLPTHQHFNQNFKIEKDIPERNNFNAINISQKGKIEEKQELQKYIFQEYIPAGKHHFYFIKIKSNENKEENIQYFCLSNQYMTEKYPGSNIVMNFIKVEKTYIYK